MYDVKLRMNKRTLSSFARATGALYKASLNAQKHDEARDLREIANQLINNFDGAERAVLVEYFDKAFKGK